MGLRKRSTALLAAAAASVGAMLGFGVSAAVAAPQNPPVFDWSVTDNTGNAAFTPAPFLTDSNAAAVKAFLLSEYNANQVALAGNPNAQTTALAVKVTAPISNATAQAVFGGPGNSVPYSVKYVFADFEASSSAAEVALTKALVNQVKGSGSNSSGAFIGEFNLSNFTGDGTRSTQSGIGTAASFASVFNSSTDYKNAGVNMSNPSAYPGGPDFESQAQSGSPNIRSALFVLPIDRITFASLYAQSKSYQNVEPGANTQFNQTGTYQNIPWVSRFNNWGNNVLNNDANFNNYKYVFNTTTSAPAVDQSQLLSSNDFAAQMLQYRLRGATSFNLFNYNGVNSPTNGNSTASSVIGYSVSQEQSDALKGWNYNTNTDGTQNSILNGILSRPYAFANMVNKVPGPTASSGSISAVASGMMLSGVFDTTTSGGIRQMVLMLSDLNKTGSTQHVYFKQKFGGASIDLIPFDNKIDPLETIAGGSHLLLTFTLNTQQNAWVLTNGGSGVGGIYGQQIFASSDADRQGFGVPEPTAFSLLGVSVLGLLARRRKIA